VDGIIRNQMIISNSNAEAALWIDTFFIPGGGEAAAGAGLAMNGARAVGVGRAGMIALGEAQNTERIYITLTKYVVPDILKATMIGEAKNVARQSLSRQLRTYVQIAQARGVPFVLHMRADTIMTKPLQKAIADGLIVRGRNIPNWF
jgi:hypothetical protein